MPQLRKELLGENWIVVAEERKNRPFDYDQSVSPDPSMESCPFEPGEESQTPPETDRIAAANGNPSSWRVRSVPNKFPAFRPDSEDSFSDNGLFSSRGAYGHHEVIVENPQHDLMMDQFSTDQMDDVLTMYQRRIRDLSSRDNIEYVQIFRNSGKQAGASLSHPHSQLAAFPFVPSTVTRRLDHARDYYRDNNACCVCRMIQADLSQERRVVTTTENFLVLCPYASQYPYETWVLPIDHEARFEALTAERRRELAGLLPDTVGRLFQELAEPAFNVVLQNTPIERTDTPTPEAYFHWMLKLIPRTKRNGGFELATDVRINNIPPEYAAEQLRD